MIEGWWPTHSLGLAACLGALGMPIRSDVVLDERSGEEVTTLYVGLQSLWNNLGTDSLIADWRSGRLEEADPLHPFLCGLRACHNATAFASSLRNEDRLRLVPTTSGHAAIYERGEELLELRHAVELVETPDLNLVAALAVLGIPMIEHEGGLFRLPRFGHSLMNMDGEWMKHDAQDLITRLRNGSLEQHEPQHPLVSAYNARSVHEQLTNHLRSTVRRVLLRKPRSVRSAFVPENAGGDLLDRVQRHFRIA